MTLSPSENFDSLIIFNLSVDLDDPILAFTHDWIFEFSLRFKKVTVFCTHSGKYSLPPNVNVIAIGGGSFFRRLRAITRLWSAVLLVVRNPNCKIFHHMSTKTLVFPGLIFQILGKKQGVWYSHSHRDFWLKVTSKMNLIYFTPTSSSLPLDPARIDLQVTGHGISFTNYGEKESLELLEAGQKHAICVGRIVPVKKIENVIEAIHLSDGKTTGLTLIGPVDDKDYAEFLRIMAKKLEVELSFAGVIEKSQLYLSVRKFEFIFSETPKSTDKAAIEAAGNGLFLISTNKYSLELCGMFAFYKDLGKFPDSLTLSAQLNFLNSLSFSERQKGRLIVANSTRRQNSLESTIDKICYALN